MHSNIASGVSQRPGRVRPESGYAPPPAEFLERAKHQPYMSYVEAGERVLAGVRRNDLFILTHPEFRDGVRDRFDTTLAAFPDEPLDTEPAPPRDPVPRPRTRCTRAGETGSPSPRLGDPVH